MLNPFPPTLNQLVPGIQAILDTPPVMPMRGTPAPSEKFLRFAIATGEEMLLPVTAISDVQRLAIADILPVPWVPAWVLGLFHCRGEIVWVVDLGHLIGDSQPAQPGSRRQSHLILLEVEGQRLGLAVPVIYDIEVYCQNQLQPVQPGVLRPSLQRLTFSCVCDSDLIVLDPQRLLQRQVLSPNVEMVEPFPLSTLALGIP